MDYMQKLIETIKSYIFPAYCLGCSKEGAVLCDSCKQELRCIPNIYIDHKTEVFSLFLYEEKSLIRRVIEAGKYYYIEEIFQKIQSHIYAGILEQKAYFENIDYICPVPLHKKRLAMRGFNQAESIALIVAELLDLPVVSLLRRTKATKQQARLSKTERMENTKNAFITIENVKGRSILLVDDVYTTGSTVGACTQSLMSAGAKEVKVFVIARG